MTKNLDPTISQTFEFTSRDGTRILSARSGSGPPIILVTGGLMDGSDWQRLEPFLRPSHTVYALDRRGRGGSGDAPDYAPEREIEDFFALVEAIGGEVDMLAHSSGSLLALMALERGLPLRRIVIYEPPLGMFRLDDDQERAERIHRYVAEGNREEALRSFLQREGTNLSPQQSVQMPTGQRLAHQLELISSVPHDHLVTTTFIFDPARLASIALPALILAGTVSATWFQQGAKAVAEALPNARLQALEGQGHIAMYTAPELLARTINDFLTEP